VYLTQRDHPSVRKLRTEVRLQTQRDQPSVRKLRTEVRVHDFSITSALLY